jgi:hypothetical protein
MVSKVMFPLSQSQKTPGWAEEGGFKNSSAMLFPGFTVFRFFTVQDPRNKRSRKGENSVVILQSMFLMKNSLIPFISIRNLLSQARSKDIAF